MSMDAVLVTLVFKFLAGHALADFVLQPTSMAVGKNRNRKFDGNPDVEKYRPHWPYWLTAHALIHGGIVWLITGNVFLGFLEAALHWIIDFAKCENWTNIHIDQILHMLCKACYIIILLR
jgi:hypothetical protein